MKKKFLLATAFLTIFAAYGNSVYKNQDHPFKGWFAPWL